MRFIVGLIIVTLAAACSAPPPPPEEEAEAGLTDAQRVEIVRTIEGLTDEFLLAFRNNDFQGAAALFDFSGIKWANDAVLLSYEGVQAFFRNLEWVEWEGEWDERYVSVLAPDVAVFQGIHHATITTADGNSVTYPGSPLTVVYRLMNGRWVPAIGHFSWPEPGATEGTGD